MNKHVLTFSQIINESIGVGSVLLIKGKPSSNGRYLYATTIKGSIEIKPGIKMVFIGDEIYRVINKEGRFFGRKISYGSEEGLKGIFNMKNPGRPSIVLNHNKTPFHWITLKFNDIGSALREIGPRLFSHELILESDIDADGIEDSQDDEISVPIDDMDQRIQSEENYNSQERQKELYDIVCYEIIKAISGKESKVSPKLIEMEEVDWEEDYQEIEDNYESYEWYMRMQVYLDPNKFREYEKVLAELELGGDFMDMLDIQKSIEVVLGFSSDIELRHEYERGDYYEPDYSEVTIDSCQSSMDDIIIEDILGNESISTKSDHLQELVKNLEYSFNEHNGDLPTDIWGKLKHNILKSDGSHANLNPAEKEQYLRRELVNKRSDKLRLLKIALGKSYYGKKTEIHTQLYKDISNYWKNRIKVSEISDNELYRLQKITYELEYLDEFIPISRTEAASQHQERRRDRFIEDLKEEIKKIKSSKNS